MPEEEADTQSASSPRARSTQREDPDGLAQIRQILLGDILAELERRLGRLENIITNRHNELQHEVRRRTDVLEAHVRKELEVITARIAHDHDELSGNVREMRRKEREVSSQIEQRVARLDERLDASIARVERETRDQILAHAKSVIEELEGTRSEIRTSLVRELGIEPEALQEGPQNGAWSSSH